MSYTKRDTDGGSPEATAPNYDSNSQAQTRSTSDLKTKPTSKTEQIRELLEGRAPPSEDPAANTATRADDIPEAAQGDEPDPWAAPTPETGEDPAQGAENEPQGRPKTLKEAAERLGVDVAELYDLEISTAGDGDPVSLGAMKDAYQTGQAAQVEIAKREADLDKRESALAKDATLWTEVSETLAQTLTPEIQARLRSQAEQRSEIETGRLFAAMPELKDEKTRARFEAAIGEELKARGLGEDYKFRSHQEVLLWRDYLRLKARMDRISQFKPQAQAPKPGKSAGRGDVSSRRQSQVIEAAKTGSVQQKVAAIKTLL